MNAHDITNLIVQKFGGNRVKFDVVEKQYVDFVLGHNPYQCGFNFKLQRVLVLRS
jgi:hypothetical protein